jgi:hypothetical protein
MERHLTTFLVVVVLMTTPAVVRADWLVFPELVPDSTLRSTDSVPPHPPVITLSGIHRGQGLVRFDNGSVMVNSEGDEGSAMFVIANVDETDFTNREVGYRFHLIDGQLPEELTKLPSGAMFPQGAPFRAWIAFRWVDGRTWDQDPFACRIFVTAVDRAGNESGPSNSIAVSHDGRSDEAFALATKNYKVRALDDVAGNWTGKDERNVLTTLVISGRQFALRSDNESISGFVQAWRTEIGSQQLSIDTAARGVFSAGYERKKERLVLWTPSENPTRRYEFGPKR